MTETESEATAQPEASAPPRRYPHVAKAVLERPWALLPGVLRYMAELVRFRAEGGLLTRDEIAERLAAAAEDNGDRAGGYQAGAVRVIPMYGLISQRASMMDEFSGGTSVESLRADLRDALADPATAAIVFDVDSPGGSVDGVPELAAELRAAREQKPVAFVANTLIASAAYWLAAQGSEVVCTPSGEVGSIGVYAAHEDISKQQEMEGVRTTLVSAGTYKVEASPYQPLGDAARGAIQGQIDEFYAMFLADVAAGRRTTVQNVADSYGQGRTLLAKAALAAGMVDRIETLEATVQRLQPRQAARRPAPAQARPAASAKTTVGRPDPGWNARMKGKLR